MSLKKTLIAFIVKFSLSLSYGETFKPEQSTLIVDEQTTFQQIAQKNYSNYQFKFNNVTDYEKQLKLWNSHVGSSKILPGTKIYLDYPYDPYTGNKYEHLQLPIMDGAHQNGRLDLGVFYSISKGEYSETSNVNNSTIVGKQNSPTTFGLNYGYQFSEKFLSIRGSTYFSFLKSSSLNSIQEINTPNELGTNIYLQYNFINSPLSLFTGADYEKISVINIFNVQSLNDLNFKSEAFTYMTLGLNYRLDISNNFNISFLGSYSHILNSTSAIKGNKYILYTSLGYKDWRFKPHLFYKKHSLELKNSTSDIVRLGAGITFYLLK